MNTRYKLIYLITIFFMASGFIFSQSMNVISINIRYDNPDDKEDNWHQRKVGLVKLLKHYEPSIFGIQEGLFHQTKFIDSCLSNYKFIGVGRDDGINKGEFSAIFYDSTKFNVEEENTFWLSESPNEISVGWDASMERICTYGLFRDLKSNKLIWVFNTHFDHIGELARKNSASLIVKKIAEVNAQSLPVILMGDFNSIPEDVAIKIIKNSLDDGQIISKKPYYGPTGTFNGFTEKIMKNRIDYIFTDNLEVLEYIHIDDRLKNNRHVTDHLPVLTTIVIEK